MSQSPVPTEPFAQHPRLAELVSTLHVAAVRPCGPGRPGAGRVRGVPERMPGNEDGEAGWVLVVDDGEVVGIITPSDLTRWLRRWRALDRGAR